MLFGVRDLICPFEAMPEVIVVAIAGRKIKVEIQEVTTALYF
jgi:hypothetical protein